MKNFTKRLASLAMAATIVASLAVPAFAAEGSIPVAESSTASYTISLAGSVYTPTIRVSVQTTGHSLYINPTRGGMSGTLTGVLHDKAAHGQDVKYEYTGLGVASTPIVIRNDTDQDLAVSATATLTLGKSSEAVIATDHVLKQNSSNNKQYDDQVQTKSIYAAIVGSSIGDVDDTTDGIYDSDAGAYLISEGSSNPVFTPGSKDVAGETYAILTDSEDGVTATKLCELDAAAAGAQHTLTADEATTYNTANGLTGTSNAKAAGDKVDTVIPNYGYVMIKGEAVKSPSEAWTTKDTISAKIVLSFVGA